MRFLLTLIFGLLMLPARWWAAARGRDPLLLKPQPERDSFWLPLPAKSGVQSFFSEASDYEAGEDAGRPPAIATWATAVLLRISRWCAPKEAGSRSMIQPLDDAIPDEIYTLW